MDFEVQDPRERAVSTDRACARILNMNCFRSSQKEKKRASLMMPMNDKFSIFSPFLFLYWVFNSEGQIYGPAFACLSDVAGNYYLVHSTWKLQRQSFQNFPPHEKCYDVYRFWCNFFLFNFMLLNRIFNWAVE